MAANGTTGQNQDLNQLSSNSFLATSKSATVTKDVYTGIDGKSILSPITDLFQDSGFSFSDVLQGGKWLASKIPIVTSLVRQGQAVVNGGSLAARILGASGLAKNALTQLSPDAQGGILGSLTDNLDTFVKISNVAARVSSTDLTNISAVGSLLNQYTSSSGVPGLFSLDDQDGQVAMVAGIIHDMTSYGVPNTYQGLVSKLTNTDIISKVTSKVLPDVISSSDISSLSAMGTQLGDKSLLGINANVIGDFAKSYSAPLLGTSMDQYVNFGQIMDAYKTVDSTWNQGTRGPSTAPTSTINLTSLLGASQDFNNLIKVGSMTSTNTADKVFLAVQRIKPQSVLDSLQKAFPQTVLASNTTQALNVVPPTNFA